MVLRQPWVGLQHLADERWLLRREPVEGRGCRVQSALRPTLESCGDRLLSLPATGSAKPGRIEVKPILKLQSNDIPPAI